MGSKPIKELDYKIYCEDLNRDVERINKTIIKEIWTTFFVTAGIIGVFMVGLMLVAVGR